MRVRNTTTLGLWALLLGGLSGTAAAQTAPAMPMKDPAGWQGVVESDAGERFGRCRVSVTTPGKATLAFTMGRDRKAAIVVAAPKWAGKGEKETVRIAIDRGVPAPVEAAVTAQGYVFDVPTTPGFAQALEKGRSLFVTAGKQKVEFPLRGSRKALTALPVCVEQAVTTEAKADAAKAEAAKAEAAKAEAARIEAEKAEAARKEAEAKAKAEEEAAKAEAARKEAEAKAKAEEEAAKAKAAEDAAKAAEAAKAEAPKPAEPPAAPAAEPAPAAPATDAAAKPAQ